MASAERFHGPALVSNAAATKHTAPAAGSILRHVHVQNPSGSAVTFTMSIGADAAGTRLFDAKSIPANSEFDWYPYIRMTTTEILQALAGTNNILTLTVSGTNLT